MTFNHVAALFLQTAEHGPKVSCVQIYWSGVWTTLPLEWNQAIRLAEISGEEVRLVGADGSIVRTYRAPPKVA